MNSAARTGQLLLVVASTMLFAAFTSAMVVRRGISADWIAPDLPSWIWLTVPLILASSYAVNRGWIQLAIACGLLFIALQVGMLAGQTMLPIGSAFLCVLAAAHAIHAALGVGALLRFGSGAALFWHFVGGLWLYVLFLFGVWA